MHVLYQLYRLLQIIGDTERKRLLKHYLRLGPISIHWLYKLLLHLTVDSCPLATGTPSWNLLVRSGKAPPARAHLRDQAAGPLGAVAPIRLQLMSAGQPSSLYRG